MAGMDMTLNFLLPLPHESDWRDDECSLAEGISGWVSADESQSLYLETMLAKRLIMTWP
jgi:hypothetical protein